MAKQIKNKGIRVPVKASKFQDIIVSGFSIEKNKKNYPVAKNVGYPSYTIRFIMAGRGYATCHVKEGQDVNYVLEPNTLFVTYPNMDVDIVQDSQNPYTLAWLTLEGMMVSSLLHKIGINRNNLLLRLHEDKELRKLFKETPYVCREHIEYSDVIATAAFFNVIQRVLMQTGFTNDGSAAQLSTHVKNASQYIADHFTDPDISVKAVGQAISVSPKYLSRLFKKETGTDMNRYILSKRLAAAEDLFATGEYSISQISEKLGFSSPYYFSSIYKKYNAVPPSKKVAQLREQQTKQPKQPKK